MCNSSGLVMQRDQRILERDNGEIQSLKGITILSNLTTRKLVDYNCRQSEELYILGLKDSKIQESNEKIRNIYMFLIPKRTKKYKGPKVE